MKKLFSSITVIGLILAGCQREVSFLQTPGANKKSLSEFVKANRNSGESFSIVNTREITVATNIKFTNLFDLKDSHQSIGSISVLLGLAF
ncbi:MAG: hypothetical protein ABI594_11715 [Ginsengibacter sp.]